MCPMPVCFLTTLYARVNTEYFTALTVQCYVDIDPTVNIYELTQCLWCFCQCHSSAMGIFIFIISRCSHKLSFIKYIQATQYLISA